MKSIVTILAGLIVSAFFIVGALADKSSYVQVDQCVQTNQETVLTDAIKETPDLLMVGPIEGEELKWFFDRVKSIKMMGGELDIDKVYVFLSENHEHWVYVFFLNEECIVDVKFTYKNLVEFFITGDKTLITPKGAKNG